MDSIRNIAASLCIALVITCIFTMLLPGKGWNQFARFAVRLFFLLCLVTPFLGGGGKLDFDADQYFSGQEERQKDLAQLTQRQLQESFEENLRRAAWEILTRNGIAPEKIQVETYISPDQHIDIISLNVTLKGEAQLLSWKISSLLEEAFGLQPQLEFQDE